ncbi:amidohydrolase family protein [Spirosoma validum]|uniref:Amidohydrolase n=1 Tax=Spirosoma validum TaxID=2771355 RepID=A0A927GG21_9BACT|nr:amidohydrolase family protein [Spirosoma validum]MBD2756547.1 amidohydrolase [Spirosoma validum]
MHIHSYDQGAFLRPIIEVAGVRAAKTASAHFQETYQAFTTYSIVKAVVSGSPTSVDNWLTQDKEHKFIAGIAMDEPTDYGMDSVRFEQLVKDKKILVFGEIGAYYGGSTLNHPGWQPYLRICQRYDIPVAIHLGGGPPQSTYSWAPKARLQLSDPFLIEDVLVRYPKLRIYMMHSGEVWYEHALRLMAFYPQLYSDLGALLWVEPLTKHYASEFLKLAKEGGYLKRVMFGSDQMRWPGGIGKSVDYLKSLPFLSQEDKADLFYNNAARFLKLKNQ